MAKTPTQAIFGYTEIVKKEKKYVMHYIEMLTGYRDLQIIY